MATLRTSGLDSANDQQNCEEWRPPKAPKGQSYCRGFGSLVSRLVPTEEKLGKMTLKNLQKATFLRLGEGGMDPLTHPP